MKNIKDTIMSQYANSPKLLALIGSMNDIIDPQYFIDDFYENVFRLSSARGFGLDIWADKVGVSRSAPVQNPNSKTFGFSPDYQPFGTYPFSSGGEFSSYTMTDEELRQVIIFKAAANIIYATALNINTFLASIFGDRRAYYITNGNMTANYVFEFTLSNFESMIVYALRLLPEPSGVKISYNVINIATTFGFSGSRLSNFNNGAFYNG